jgi:hypothetical protein
MRKRTINLLLAAGVFAAVASLARPPRAAEAARDGHRVITRLVGRSQAITVVSTPAGVRYSIDVDGRTILANATLEQVRVAQPEAFRQIQSSVAQTSTTAEPTWAGVDMIDAMDR